MRGCRAYREGPLLFLFLGEVTSLQLPQPGDDLLVLSSRSTVLRTYRHAERTLPCEGRAVKQVRCRPRQPTTWVVTPASPQR